MRTHGCDRSEVSLLYLVFKHPVVVSVTKSEYHSHTQETHANYYLRTCSIGTVSVEITAAYSRPLLL
jgi:hypothetical protein